MFVTTAFLRADFLFWLDSPTGRNNPFDPRNPRNQNSGDSLPIAPGPSFTGLTVKVVDNNNVGVAGIKVMLNTNTAGAISTDASGNAAFPGAATPATVHVFAQNASFIPVITWLNVAGPQATVGIGGIAGSSSNQATITASVTHSGVSGNWHLKGIPFSRTRHGNLNFGTTINAFSVTSQSNFQQVYLSAAEGGGLTFTGALFAPPVAVVAGAASVAGTLSASGWSNQFFNFNVSGVPPTTSTNIEAYAGSTWDNSWYCPDIVNYQNASSGIMGSYAVPDGAGYYRFFVECDELPSSNPLYSYDFEVESASWPSTLNLTPPPKIVLTQSPTAANPHLVLQNPGGASADVMIAAVSTGPSYSAAAAWAVMYFNPPANAVLDATYPYPYPSGVTLSALPVGVTMNVGGSLTDYFGVSNVSHVYNAFSGIAGQKLSTTFFVYY